MGAERIHRPIRQSSGPDRQWSGTQKQPRLRYSVGAVKPPDQQPQARGEFASRNLLSNPEMAAQVFGQDVDKNHSQHKNDQAQDSLGQDKQQNQDEPNCSRCAEESKDKLTQEVSQLSKTLTFNYNEPPPDGCHDLIRQIIELGVELIERYAMMKNDGVLHNLYNRRRFERDPVITDRNGHDLGSWEGHRKIYEKQREALQERIDVYDNKDGCDEGDLYYLGVELEFSNAEQQAGREAPKQPDSVNGRQGARQQILDMGLRGVEIVGNVLKIPLYIAYGIFLILKALAELAGLTTQRI